MVRYVALAHCMFRYRSEAEILRTCMMGNSVECVCRSFRRRRSCRPTQHQPYTAAPTSPERGFGLGEEGGGGLWCEMGQLCSRLPSGWCLDSLQFLFELLINIQDVLVFKLASKAHLGGTQTRICQMMKSHQQHHSVYWHEATRREDRNIGLRLLNCMHM